VRFVLLCPLQLLWGGGIGSTLAILIVTSFLSVLHARLSENRVCDCLVLSVRKKRFVATTSPLATISTVAKPSLSPELIRVKPTETFAPLLFGLKSGSKHGLERRSNNPISTSPTTTSIIDILGSLRKTFNSDMFS